VANDLNRLYENMSADPESFWSEVRSLVLRLVHYNEDQVQDVLVYVMESLPRYKHDGRFDHWLSRIVRTTRLKALRNRKNEVPLNEEIAIPAPDSDGLPDLSFLNTEERKIADHILAGYSFEEIGEQLGVSADAVRKRLRRSAKKAR